MKNNKQEMSDRYGHYLDHFIKEVNPLTSREEILSQMDIYPIFFEKTEVGVLGMTTHRTKVGANAIVRLIYILPDYRGDRMGIVLEQLFEKLVSEGFTHIESWALPHIAKWLEANWQIRPKVFVYHEDLKGLQKKIKELKSTPRAIG